MMKHDENTKDALYDSLSSKITALGVKFGTATAFIMPELTSLSEQVLTEYIKDKELSEYDYFLKGVLKEKAHVLSENEEKILAESGDAMSTFRDIFTKIDNADINFGQIKDGKEKITLSHGTYSVIMHDVAKFIKINLYLCTLDK